MRDGHTREAAVGHRQWASNRLFCGRRRAVVARMSPVRLDAGQRTAPKVHDVLVRDADCLTAQALQSAGCATL
jgi:hypothetical protein